MIVDETGLNREQSLARHRKVANEMRMLMELDGWKYLHNKMQQDMAAALAAMRDAKTGDESLKACTAYTILEAYTNLPEIAVTQSLQRIKSIEEEVVPRPPEHHRSGQFPKSKG